MGFDFFPGDEVAGDTPPQEGSVRSSTGEEPWGDVDDLDRLAELVRPCQRCVLAQTRRGVVFGEGSPRASLMLVGEGPGATEDELGRPFVGKAGQLLDRILEAAGFERSQVYIGNVVKCRPPGNRLPLPDETAACLPHLKAQIRIIRPKIIVCLGASASQTLIDKSIRITKDRGVWREEGGIKYLPTFHPAALLRDPSKKRPVWQDFQSVREEYLRITGSKETC